MSDIIMHASDTPGDNATTSAPQPQPQLMVTTKKRKHEPARATTSASASASTSSSSSSAAIIHPMHGMNTREDDEQCCIRMMHQQKDEEETEIESAVQETKTRRMQETPSLFTAAAAPKSISSSSSTSSSSSSFTRVDAPPHNEEGGCATTGVGESFDDEMAVDLRIEEELCDRGWCYNTMAQTASIKPTSHKSTSGSVDQLYRDTIISIAQFLTFDQLATTMRINRQWHHAVMTQPTRRMHVSIDIDHTSRLCRAVALSRHISSIELIEAVKVIKMSGNNQPDWYEVEQQAWEEERGAPTQSHTRMDRALDLLVDAQLPHLDRLVISLPLHHEDSVRRFVFPSRLCQLEVDFRARPNTYDYGDHSLWPHISALIGDITVSSSVTLLSLTIRTNHDSVSSSHSGPPNDLLEPLTQLPHLTSFQFITGHRYRRFGVEWNRDHMRSIHRMHALRHLRLSIAPCVWQSRSSSHSSHLMWLIDPERIQLAQLLGFPFPQPFDDAPRQLSRDEKLPPPRVLALETMGDIESYTLSELHMQHVFAHLPQLTQLRPKSIEMSIEGLTQLKNLIDVKLHFRESLSFTREPFITLLRMTQLRRLDLHHPLLSDFDLTQLLTSLTLLESLTLSGRCQLRTLNAFSSPRVLPHVSQRLQQLELIQLETLDANSLIHLYGLQQLRRLDIIECFSSHEFRGAEKLFAPFRRYQAASPSTYLSSSTFSDIFTASPCSSYSFPHLTSSQLAYEFPPDPDACGCGLGLGGSVQRDRREENVQPVWLDEENPTVDELIAYEAERYLDTLQEFEFAQENGANELRG